MSRSVLEAQEERFLAPDDLSDIEEETQGSVHRRGQQGSVGSTGVAQGSRSHRGLARTLMGQQRGTIAVRSNQWVQGSAGFPIPQRNWYLQGSLAPPASVSTCGGPWCPQGSVVLTILLSRGNTGQNYSIVHLSKTKTNSVSTLFVCRQASFRVAKILVGIRTPPEIKDSDGIHPCSWSARTRSGDKELAKFEDQVGNLSVLRQTQHSFRGEFTGGLGPGLVRFPKQQYPNVTWAKSASWTCGQQCVSMKRHPSINFFRSRMPFRKRGGLRILNLVHTNLQEQGVSGE